MFYINKKKQNIFFFQKFSNIVIDLMFDTLLAYILYILVDKPFNNIYELISSNESVGDKGHEVKDFYDKDHLNNNNHISKL
jgi:hypothetical protein